GERLVPAEAALSLALPAAARDRLDGLHRDATLAAQREQGLQIGGVLHVAEHGEVVGHQHGVEGKALEAAAMHLGRPRAMPGDADEADLALLAGLDERLQRAARAERRLPLSLVHQIVELNEVDALDPQALEGAPDARARAV